MGEAVVAQLLYHAFLLAAGGFISGFGCREVPGAFFWALGGEGGGQNPAGNPKPMGRQDVASLEQGWGANSGTRFTLHEK